MKSYWPLNLTKIDKSCRLYLLSGTEELLVDESHQQLIALAKSSGFVEHHRLYGTEDLDQTKLQQLIINKGLFAEGTLIDFRLPEGKTGRSGATVLNNILDKLEQHSHIFFILSAHNTKGKLSTKWVEKIEKSGSHIQHPILNDTRKRQWLTHRLKIANITIEQKGQEFLLLLTEGNLLALEQQIKQLEISQLSNITVEELRKRFQDEARFNLFSLPEKIFNGQANRALRMCRKLRQEGEPLVLILWSIINELNLAIGLAELQKQQQSPSNFLKQNRIWKEHEATLYKLANKGLEKLYHQANTLHKIDKQSKGQAIGDGWLSLEKFIGELAIN